MRWFQEYITSGWNLNNLPIMESSVLKYIDASISGMKVFGTNTYSRILIFDAVSGGPERTADFLLNDLNHMSSRCSTGGQKI